MTPADIARRRLSNERLVGAPLTKPEDAVAWLGAVQAQDYSGAKWAVAQRVKACTESDVEGALQNGSIVRTHLLRPTWHFVVPADIRWMLELTAPRVHAANAYMYRKLGLTAATFKRSNAAIAGALVGGHHRTREELSRVLAKRGIDATGLHLAYLLMCAELDAIVCSGPRRGKQFTYALLDERVPAVKRRRRSDALAELTRRYFRSRGPATLRDFSKWSGLTATDAKAGVQIIGDELQSEIVEGKMHWFVRRPISRQKAPTAHLLPNYDEYFIGYKDAGAGVIHPSFAARLGRGSGILDKHIVAMNGKVIGGWRRTIQKGEVVIETDIPVPLDRAENRALCAAAERFGLFLGLPVALRSASK